MFAVPELILKQRQVKFNLNNGGANDDSYRKGNDSILNWNTIEFFFIFKY